MKEVTREEFYRIIKEKKLDVHPHITNSSYPYSTEFRFPFGQVYGKIVRTPTEERKSYPFYTEQYLINEKYL